MLSKGNLTTHSSLAVRLRRAEKNILASVVRYAAEQKASAVDRAAMSSQLPPEPCADQIRVLDVPISTGEEEFVRVDGVRVYGSMEERVALETDFRNSVLRGDYRAVSSAGTEADNLSAASHVEQTDESHLGCFEQMKIDESAKTSEEAKSSPDDDNGPTSCEPDSNVVSTSPDII